MTRSATIDGKLVQYQPTMGHLVRKDLAVSRILREIEAHATGGGPPPRQTTSPLPFAWR
jgi:hypothetical protein